MDKTDLTKLQFIDCPRTVMYSSKHFPKILCVYFLFFNDELKYVGRTVNLQQRMQSHKSLSSSKIFDKIGYMVINDKSDREMFETKMINKYNPPDNGDFWT